MNIRSDRTHHVDRSVDDVWGALARVEDYRRWWPWLRRLDANGLIEGDEWACTVQPPLPYNLRFTIAIDEVREGASVSATVRGDIHGSAELTMAEVKSGCDLRLTSVLAPSNRALRTVSTVAPWMARFGHDWVVRTGLEQFRRNAW